MKGLIIPMIIGLATASAELCCTQNEIIKPGGYCGNQTQRINFNCTHGHMLLRDIILNGTKLSTQDSPGFVFAENSEEYCLGEMYRNNSMEQLGTMPVAVICFQEIYRDSSSTRTSGILCLISAFFLFATFAVYMYLHQLRDLQGLCYMCLCISMALGFLSLGTLQLNPGFTGDVCTTTGFLLYFWMMATFFWMNVISINMYRIVIDASYLKKTEKKQYFFYSCYAWGGALFFLTVSLIANFSEGDHWKPNISKQICWFVGRTETWIFFYGPIAILVTSNVILFILSLYNLLRHARKYEVNVMKNLMYKFLLSLKLFLVMGISWIFEIASFAHGESNIVWTILDRFNSLQGVIIFLLLVVLRRRVMQGLTNENCCLSVTRPLTEKLSPYDDADDKHILTDDNTVEVRLN